MLYEKIEKDEKDIVFVYTTFRDEVGARSVGYLAIEDKLAISADYWLINSIYPWQGVVQEAGQCMLMFTTEKLLSEELVKFIESNHPYNVPMVIRSNTSLVNQAYKLWVDNTLESDKKYITEEENELNIEKASEGYGYGRLK